MESLSHVDGLIQDGNIQLKTLIKKHKISLVTLIELTVMGGEEQKMKLLVKETIQIHKAQPLWSIDIEEKTKIESDHQGMEISMTVSLMIQEMPLLPHITDFAKTLQVLMLKSYKSRRKAKIGIRDTITQIINTQSIWISLEQEIHLNKRKESQNHKM